MASYIIIVEGYTDCALIEAIIEKSLGFQLYKKKNEMPEIFQALVNEYPSAGGDLKRSDTPHFFYKGDKKIAVKVAGGESNIAMKVENALQAADVVEKEDIDRFLVFVDKDRHKKLNEIEKLLKDWYQERGITFDIEKNTVSLYEKEYLHYVYAYPENRTGTVEKILLEIGGKIYPDLMHIAENTRAAVFDEQFDDLRSKKWSKNVEVQEFYGDKVQIGTLASILKPDRPIGYAIKDEIIKTKYLTELDKVEEFRKLQDFLKSNIDN